MLPLFDDPPGFDRARLAEKLSALARDGIFIGTSSWKYEGWLGQIYQRSRYLARGRFSQKQFEAECLGEYAETFPSVCGDFTFYQFPGESQWSRLFASAGPRLRFAFKVPEEITARRFPLHARYGARAGLENPGYLDAGLFHSAFCDPLAAHRERVAVLIFEFATFAKQLYPDADSFTADLDGFLSKLPAAFRYAVEVRNAEFLTPAYFACLKRHGVAHVFNAWTRMPELGEQIQIADAFTAGFVVARALLRRGRPYEDAVRAFAPYQRIQDENPAARRAIRELIRAAREQRREAYIYVNNRLEGNAPMSIEAILEVD